jgi:hypothetical protein
MQLKTIKIEKSDDPTSFWDTRISSSRSRTFTKLL